MNPDGTGPSSLPMLVARLDQQDHLLHQFAQALQTLLARTAHPSPAAVRPVVVPVSAPTAAPVVAPETTPAPVVAPAVSRGMTGSAPLPQRFGGEPTQCRGFLNQVGIYFELLQMPFPLRDQRWAS